MPVWSAFILGLVGSIHCAGMCGPLVFALHKRGNGAGKIVYHLGRILAYAALGMVLGLLGFAAQLAGWQSTFSVILGALLLISVVLPLLLPRLAVYSPANKIGSWLSSKLNRWMAWAINVKGPFKQFYLGAINGLLPCGMVYVAIAGALSMANYAQGSLYMILFGLGTWPVLLVFSFGSQFATRFSWINLKKLTPIFVCCLGLLLIWRGLNLRVEYTPDTSNGNPFAGITICQGA